MHVQFAFRVKLYALNIPYSWKILRCEIFEQFQSFNLVLKSFAKKSKMRDGVITYIYCATINSDY